LGRVKRLNSKKIYGYHNNNKNYNKHTLKYLEFLSNKQNRYTLWENEKVRIESDLFELEKVLRGNLQGELERIKMKINALRWKKLEG